MFQNLRQGSQVYLMYTSQAELRVEIGTVESTNAQMLGMYQLPNYPLEIAVRLGQRVIPYRGVNGSAESAIAQEQTTGEKVIIACSKDAINNEIAKLKQEAINHFNMNEFYSKRSLSCDNIHMQVNPEEVEKAQQQQEMKNMREELSDMHKKLEEQSEINKKLLVMLEGREASSPKSREEYSYEYDYYKNAASADGRTWRMHRARSSLLWQGYESVFADET